MHKLDQLGEGQSELFMSFHFKIEKRKKDKDKGMEKDGKPVTLGEVAMVGESLPSPHLHQTNHFRATQL